MAHWPIKELDSSDVGKGHARGFEKGARMAPSGDQVPSGKNLCDTGKQ